MIRFLVLKEPKCPYCESKLHRHQKVDFLLNNTVKMKKMTYRCSGSECGRVITPKWSLFIEAGCNYTKAVKQYALELGLICNVSYEKMAEIIYWAHGVEISREILYKYRKENFADFVAKIRKQLEELRKELKIEFSRVLCYDEQYVLVMGEWMYKLTALDSRTGHVHDFCIATKKEFNQEFVKKFLESIVKGYKIHTVVTDGHNMYPSVMEELEVHHKLCNFHKMQALLRKILGKLISYNKKIKKIDTEIEENKEKIEEITEQRKGKIGRPKKEEQALVDEKYNLERQNREKTKQKREYKQELQVYVDLKDDVSLLLRSKARETGDNRYERLTSNMDEIPKEAKGFINKLDKELDSLLLHTELDDVPTTNNLIELYHLTTLNRHDKKKYKTIEGVFEETFLKTLRWEKRVVLSLI